MDSFVKNACLKEKKKDIAAGDVEPLRRTVWLETLDTPSMLLFAVVWKDFH